jgi:threonine dehydratase
VGAFKFRGACNAVFSLPASSCQSGVIAHSSGNHAQALALAAKMRGIPAYIVMPSNAPEVKKAAVAEYGAQITFCEPTLQARESTQEMIIARTGAVEIHPYDNFDVIAGQATATLELLQEYPDLEVVVAPVGGGGLLAGTALAAHFQNNKIQVYGAEPQNADDAFRSLLAGRIIPSNNPSTVADGLLTSLGGRNFPILQEHLSGIVLASESAIIEHMRLFWERAKLVIEPSAATALAAIAANNHLFAGKKIGVVVSGGNVDLNRLPWL